MPSPKCSWAVTLELTSWYCVQTQASGLQTSLNSSPRRPRFIHPRAGNPKTYNWSSVRLRSGSTGAARTSRHFARLWPSGSRLKPQLSAPTPLCIPEQSQNSAIHTRTLHFTPTASLVDPHLSLIESVNCGARMTRCAHGEARKSSHMIVCSAQHLVENYMRSNPSLQRIVRQRRCHCRTIPELWRSPLPTLGACQ
jgi:hypothetical protein